jgi:hypothetical protein
MMKAAHLAAAAIGILVAAIAIRIPDVAAQQNWNGTAQQRLDLPIPDFQPAPPPDPKKVREHHKEKFNKPVYNPETKSYFEYYSPTLGEYHSEQRFNWMTSKAMAEARTYKGVPGRLAVIKTPETNKFIIKNFEPDDGAWIGLQYLCELRALRWVTGEFWPLTGYQYWNKPWNVAGTTWKNNERAWCLASVPYMGVHYWGAEGGYRWNANGPGKEFHLMIIEYPTGKP